MYLNLRKKNEKPERRKKNRAEQKSAQRAIPLRQIFPEGIFEQEKGHYSCSIRFDDVNYHTARQEKQESIFAHWCGLLNLLGAETTAQLTILNHTIRSEEFRRQIQLDSAKDGFDEYRGEWNDMLFPRDDQAKPTIWKKKLLTISTEALGLEEARSDLNRLSWECVDTLRKTGSTAASLGTNERLELLHDSYRPDHAGEFDPDGITAQRRRGATYRDLIAADGLEFKPGHMRIGEKFAQALYVRELPAFLTDQILDMLTGQAFPLMLSLHLQPLDPGEALRLIKKQITGMESNKMDRQKKGFTRGYIEPFIPFELRNSLEEANELLDDVVNKDQKLFLSSLVILHMADSLEELRQQKEAILAAGRKKGCQIGVLYYQQQEGLNAALPLGVNKLRIDRCLPTESAGIFLPFSNQELLQKNGMYYGRNDRTGNLILFDRLGLKTPAGFILGTPGSGKSFLAKKEIINVLLATGDDVILIDPEREYTKLTQAFGGEVIHISAASANHINPMDLTQDYSMGEDGQEQDPLSLKADFIMSLFEVILGGNTGLSPKQKSIVDRCLRDTYAPLMQHNWDTVYMPTLKDFHQIMADQKEEEAQDMAVSLEMYVLGNLKVFSHHTNVDTNNRLICYDTKDLGKSLKTMGMLIVLDAIWNRVTRNREQGKRTRLYVDEMSLFFQSEYLSTYFDEVYRRFRKWGGVPTGITQNIKPMLRHETARTMLSNSDFLIIMNQATSDRDELAELLKISEELLGYVTNAEEGYGLISIGKSILPFRDRFPKNTSLYRMMTTKINEIGDQKTEEKKWRL